MKSTGRALLNLHGHWAPAIAALVSLLLVNAASLVAPQLLRVLIDDGITPLDMDVVWWTTGGLFAVALLRGLFNFLQGYLSEVTSQGVAFDLRNQIFEKLQHLSFSYHDQAQTGRLNTRMTSDVEIVRMFLGRGFINLLSGITLLFGTAALLFSMDWKLALIVVVMIPLIAVVFAWGVRSIFPISWEVQKKLSALNTILQENLAGMRVVKAFARHDYELARYEEQNRDLLEENLRFVRLFTTLFPLIFLIGNLTTVAVVWAGGLEVINLNLTLGELVAFVNYLGFMLMPLFMIGMVAGMLSRAEASAQRIFEVIDAESEVREKDDAIKLPPVRGEVVFDQVSFRYIGGEQEILQKLSFAARPGQTVAILGQTGSGKSTIINLIPRFYDVTGGRVLIDGHDVRDLTLDSLRTQIGIVLQETTLFSGTIRDNIAYGRPDASLEEVIEAAKAAQAHEFVEALPRGYDTEVGERGVGLSGGQKQRVAIARALLVDPRILILDDSTSAVDAETEYHIQRALERLMQGRTSFVIAQRVSTVRNADLILLLEDGQLAEQGTHEELIRTSPLYCEILDTQFDAWTEELLATEQEAAS